MVYRFWAWIAEAYNTVNFSTLPLYKSYFTACYKVSNKSAKKFPVDFQQQFFFSTGNLTVSNTANNPLHKE